MQNKRSHFYSFQHHKPKTQTLHINQRQLKTENWRALNKQGVGGLQTNESHNPRTSWRWRSRRGETGWRRSRSRKARRKARGREGKHCGRRRAAVGGGRGRKGRCGGGGRRRGWSGRRRRGWEGRGWRGPKRRRPWPPSTSPFFLLRLRRLIHPRSRRKETKRTRKTRFWVGFGFGFLRVWLGFGSHLRIKFYRVLPLLLYSKLLVQI